MAGNLGCKRIQVPEIPLTRRRELGDGAVMTLVLIGEMEPATALERSSLAH